MQQRAGSSKIFLVKALYSKTINLPCIIFANFFKILILLIYFLQILYSNFNFCLQKFTPQICSIILLNCLKFLKKLLRIFLKLFQSFSNTFVCFAKKPKIIKNVFNCLKLYISNCLKIARCLKITFQICKANQYVLKE